MTIIFSARFADLSEASVLCNLCGNHVSGELLKDGQTILSPHNEQLITDEL